jgi:hypothetical protein
MIHLLTNLYFQEAVELVQGETDAQAMAQVFLSYAFHSFN